MYNLENITGIKRQLVKESDTNIRKFSKISAFYLDYQSIVFSAAFRRLLDKAQLFPLEQFDYVRTRLTHSIEVEAIAEEIITKICMHRPELKNKKTSLKEIIRCSSLIHDLGNPPYGHYGEDIIQRYFSENIDSLSISDELKIKLLKNKADRLTDCQKSDFINFDGNAQSLRIITHLESPLYFQSSFNLTSAVLGSVIKYPRSSLGNKKFGYFNSEEDVADFLIKEGSLILGETNPLALILEASDDIAYLFSDLNDAIKKNIITLEKFEFELEKFANTTDADSGFKQIKEDYYKYKEENKNSNLPFYNTINGLLKKIRLTFIYNIVSYVVSLKDFCDLNCELIGSISKDFKTIDNAIVNSIDGTKKFLKVLIANYVYCDKEIIANELEGESILYYLLDIFTKAAVSVNIDESGNSTYFDKNDKKKYFHEQKVFNLISDHLRNKCLQSIKKEPNKELYFRLKLVTDYVSGMTDSYAKNIYCHLKGIK